MKQKLTYLTFLIVLVLATFTRAYKLGVVPSGLYLDEAAQGFNAYSILKTGKDEFGKSFPTIFRSFTDFKAPVYTYLVVPFIPIFGLTKFTVRLPSFIFSILTFPILFLLIKVITPKKRSLSLALITSYLLSISPWHILFSRTAFECILGLFFFLTGICFFYISLKKPKQLIFSAIFLSLAISAYHAQRVVAPLMIIIFFVRFRKLLVSKTHFRYLILGGVLGFLILASTLKVSLTPGFLSRATNLNIFNQALQKPSGYLDNCNHFLCKIGNNTAFLSIKEFSSLYLSYFSPRNMFFLGDYEKRVSFPNLSTFYLWQLPFYILGLFLIAIRKELKELRFFTIAFLLISPIPAAVTRDPYSTIRSLQMVVPLNMIVALAIVESYFFLRKLKVQRAKKLQVIYLNIFVSVLAIFITIYSLAKLYSSVIILNEYYRAREWNFGFEKVANTIKKIDASIPIVMDNSRTEPYAQLLFFLKFDPTTYQKNNFEIPLSEYYTNMARNKEKIIGSVTTRPINWERDLSNEQYLVGDSLAISEQQMKEHNLSLITKVKYPDGSIAFIVVKTNPKK